MILGFPKVAEDAHEGAEASPNIAVAAKPDVAANHLARELHDLVAQPLISLVLEISEMRSHGALNPESTQEMARLEDSARTVLRNTRELLVDLRGQGEIRLNFREVLKKELLRNPNGAKLAPATKLQVSSTWPERINGWAAFNLLRIVHEAIANATRHGRATSVEVILSTSKNNDEAVLVVIDDGAGLGDAMPGIGMVGMHERAVILGGRFSVVPRLAGGTRVEVRIPLQRLR